MISGSAGPLSVRPPAPIPAAAALPAPVAVPVRAAGFAAPSVRFVIMASGRDGGLSPLVVRANAGIPTTIFQRTAELSGAAARPAHTVVQIVAKDVPHLSAQFPGVAEEQVVTVSNRGNSLSGVVGMLRDVVESDRPDGLVFAAAGGNHLSPPHLTDGTIARGVQFAAETGAAVLFGSGDRLPHEGQTYLEFDPRASAPFDFYRVGHIAPSADYDTAVRLSNERLFGKPYVVYGDMFIIAGDALLRLLQNGNRPSRFSSDGDLRMESLFVRPLWAKGLAYLFSPSGL